MVTFRPNRRVMPCYYAGSLNGSGVTVNECARDSGLKSRSANNTGSMRFVSVVHDYERRLSQSPFQPSSANTTEKKPLLPGNFLGVQYIRLKIRRRKVYSMTEKY